MCAVDRKYKPFVDSAQSYPKQGQQAWHGRRSRNTTPHRCLRNPLPCEQGEPAAPAWFHRTKIRVGVHGPIKFLISHRISIIHIAHNHLSPSFSYPFFQIEKYNNQKKNDVVGKTWGEVKGWISPENWAKQSGKVWSCWSPHYLADLVVNYANWYE